MDRASMLASLEVSVAHIEETITDRVLYLSADCKFVDGKLMALLNHHASAYCLPSSEVGPIRGSTCLFPSGWLPMETGRGNRLGVPGGT